MTKKEIELSVIVVSYNTRKITENCIKSLINSLSQTAVEYEIILVDNNSTDGTVAEIKKIIPSKNGYLNIFPNKDNLGFAKANNQGIDKSRGTYILLLNSDTIVIENAIEQLLRYYRANETKIHFIGGKLLNADLSPQASCGPFYSLPVIFGALFLRGDYWGLTRSSPLTNRKVDWVSGACILTKKKYLDSLGGFDENIFMYMDEIDLLYRAKQKGYQTYFYPEARFIHLGSASSQGKTYPILQVYKGFTYFYKKHHNSGISILLLKIMLQLKSFIAICIGRITGNRYLIETYEKAKTLV